MITKYAKAEEILEVKMASGRLPFDVADEPGANLMKFASLDAKESEDGYLYVRCRAISSRVNKNNDGWPSEELAKSYKSFIGRPIFVDHNNDNPERARGVIVDSRLHVEDADKTSSFDPYYASAPENHKPPTWIELLLELDAKTFPKLANAVRKGHIDAVSMGANIETSICSVCSHVAKTPIEYCSHVSSKGAEFEITADNGDKMMKKAYEDCHDITFFEISFVFDPADPTALISEKSDKKIAKTASEGTLYSNDYPELANEIVEAIRSSDSDDLYSILENGDGQFGPAGEYYVTDLDLNIVQTEQGEFQFTPDYLGASQDDLLKTLIYQAMEKISKVTKEAAAPEDVVQASRDKVKELILNHPDIRWDELEIDEFLNTLSVGDIKFFLKALGQKAPSTFVAMLKTCGTPKEAAEQIFKVEYPYQCEACDHGTPTRNGKYLFTYTPYKEDENGGDIVYCDFCGEAYSKDSLDDIVADDQAMEAQMDELENLPVTLEGPSEENSIRGFAAKEALTQVINPDEIERDLNYVPQSELTSSPESYDTLKEEDEGKEFQCPNCHSDTLMSDAEGMLKCPSCSWVQPPHPMDNPDLGLHLEMDIETETQDEALINEEEEPKVTFFEAQSNTLINEMTWQTVSNKIVFDRISAVLPKKTILNPSYVTKTEDPQNAKVIADQKKPVTSSTEKVNNMENTEKESSERTLLAAISLADDFVQLGLIEEDRKLAFVAELESETSEALEARKATISLVKQAGLARPVAKVSGLSKVPKFASFKGESSVDLDDVPFESIFM